MHKNISHTYISILKKKKKQALKGTYTKIHDNHRNLQRKFSNLYLLQTLILKTFIFMNKIYSFPEFKYKKNIVFFSMY